MFAQIIFREWRSRQARGGFPANINLSVRYTFTERHIGRSIQENNFFCALYINLPFRLVGLSYAVEFLKDLGGDTRAVVGFNLELAGGVPDSYRKNVPTTNQSKAESRTH